MKELPILVQIAYGFILFFGIIVKAILKVIVRLLYFIVRLVVVFNEKKIRPITNSIYELLYSRACAVFDYDDK